MKKLLALICVLFQLHSFAQNTEIDTVPKIFIITLDGMRWQELFTGIDPKIVANPKFTKDSALANDLFGGADEQESRARLMPFMWNVVAKKGQLYGNRNLENYASTANIYSFSYPGYSEMFTGKISLLNGTNSKSLNKHKNIFHALNETEEYKDRIAIFTSWAVIPYALKNPKSFGIPTNGGYENLEYYGDSSLVEKLNYVQDNLIENTEGTRSDMLTFVAAKQYLEKFKPRIFYLGLGDTDEYAHGRDYNMYLQKANEADRIISELWYWTQSQKDYKGRTTFIITTDHGRGKFSTTWSNHNSFVRGSSEIWMAFLGNGIEPLGEINREMKIYQQQIAQTIANFAGINFGRQRPIISRN